VGRGTETRCLWPAPVRLQALDALGKIQSVGDGEEAR